ncbi:MAG: hypothetical protein RSC93_07210 [Erysipelotrichaceae bacterium]
MNFNVKSKKYIILKEHNNRKLIVGFLISVLVVGMFATSKLWLPDGRKVVKKNLETDILFTMNEVRLKPRYLFNSDTLIGELKFSERRTYDKDKYKVIYKVVDDKGVVLPLNIIKGNQESIKDSIKVEQDVMLQFRLPKEFYYVKIEISQKDNITQEVIIDYRMFKDKAINEKGSDYLTNLELEEQKSKELEEPLIQIDKRLKEIKQALVKETDEVKKTELVNEQSNLLAEKEGKNKMLQEQMRVVKGMKDV